ncbi:hypothetical protein GO986_19735 [Deinococcus sp. HMF7620]|uniref:Uncharacterized protein n=1 Tax=Deinococcus arboris TaxID=2682977 RepID=A0A7C9LQY9_9DEIO|nr:hypothetical protein [Deinococcus arboris]MVN88976.1 hypothetical protein [Deinococcus arboris]
MKLTPEQVVAGLRQLHPGIDLMSDVEVLADARGTVELRWHRDGPAPTEMALLAAAGVAQAQEAARRDLRECQALLDERAALLVRAQLTGNTVAEAEIKAEAQDLLTYMEELRNAPDPT